MKVTLDKARFTDELKSCASVIKTRTTLPVLNYARLHLVNDRLAITTTDTDCWFTRYPEAQTDDGAPFLIPIRTTLEFLQSGGVGNLTIEGNDEVVWLACGGKKIKFATLKDEEFPVAPTLEEVEVAEADFGPVQSIFSCADESSSELHKRTIMMEPEPGGLIAFATNGRMGGTVKFDGVINGLERLVLDASTWATASRMGGCQLSDAPSFSIFSAAAFRLIVKKPSTSGVTQWRQVIKGFKSTSTITVSREDLVEAIAACHCVRGGLERYVRVGFSPTEGGLAIAAKTSHGEHDTTIAGKVKGQFSPIGLPSDNLLQFLNAQDCDAVKIGLTDTRSAVIMEAGNVTFYFMPFIEAATTAPKE